MEKVIVVGVDSEDRIFIKAFDHETDAQLENDVEDYIGESSFFIIYEEDLDDLEEALEAMYAPAKGRKKLSFDDIRTIRTMVKSGDFKKKEIAAHFGVSRQTIWEVSKG